ncbi:MAG: 2-aminobenzoate-CoA ligase [Thermoleophilaceae bacterium]|nr:2-aminobenzoate-CoA ligase [Thermoleophilaceae bacterium]
MQAVRDVYPAGNSVPPACLVPLELQPDYGEVPGHPIGDLANVAERACDAHVESGRGDAVAAVHASSGRQLTYAQLSRDSSALAAGLRELGIRSGDRVAFRSANVPEVLTVVLAAWKAGAVVVPTPAQARADELRFFLEDTGVRALFAHTRADVMDHVAEASRAAGVEHVITFGSEQEAITGHWWDDLKPEGSNAPSPGSTPSDSVAVIWHTGGTTGQPKGCYHTHRRLLAGGYATAQATGVRPDEGWAAAAPVGHALGFMYHTTWTLLHGAKVVFVEDFHSPHALSEAVERHRIGTFTAITATWARMLEALEEQPRDTSSIGRAYAMWQSASSAQVYDGWKARGIELMNNFGTTAFAAWVLAPRQSESFPRASLGRAAPGYRVEAVELEADGVQTVPAGTTGRMAVKGPTGLTYWNRPELQRRDVVDGWTLVDDLIRFDEQGNAAYFGRTDFIISTAGYKVAPVEVEQALARHEAVGEVGVVGAPDPTRQEVVAAFVALRDGFEASDELRRELQVFAKSSLSPYKYPRRVEFVERLPRDHVGKLQQGVLKEWAAAAVEAGS